MKRKSAGSWVRHFRAQILRPLRISSAARVRARAKGCFVGVTGSSGKSTTTALIAAVLSEIGTVQGQVTDNTINPLIRTIRQSRKADFVVVEAGVGGKGEMAAMASLLRPDVAVVTLVGLEHFSAFRSSENIAEEKGGLVAALADDGLAVLNADDDLVMGMARRTRARVVTFGKTETADCRIDRVSGGFPTGITVHLRWRGERLDVPTQFLAPHFAEAVAAAVAVGLELGVPVESICTAIARLEPLPLRLSPHWIPGGPFILADCVKAPQGTLHLSFEHLRQIEAPRRRIVLGAISDYRGERRRVYRNAIAAALDVADEVILVSESRGRPLVAPEVESAGRFRNFLTVREAAEHIASTAITGEAILLKGSANFHLERILLNMLTEVNCWLDGCGKGVSCNRCGLYEFPFEDHAKIRRRRRWARAFGRSEAETVPARFPGPT